MGQNEFQRVHMYGYAKIGEYECALCQTDDKKIKNLLLVKGYNGTFEQKADVDLSPAFYKADYDQCREPLPESVTSLFGHVVCEIPKDILKADYSPEDMYKTTQLESEIGPYPVSLSEVIENVLNNGDDRFASVDSNDIWELPNRCFREMHEIAQNSMNWNVDVDFECNMHTTVTLQATNAIANYLEENMDLKQDAEYGPSE